MTARKLFLRTLGAALTAGGVFWLFDSLAHHYYFGRYARHMPAGEPSTLLDTFWPNITSHMFFVRLSFLSACLIGGWIAAYFMNSLRKSEMRLWQVEEKYRTVVEQANEGIYIMQDRERKYYNPRWLEMTGYSADEYADVPFFALIHPDDVAKAEAQYTEILTGRVMKTSFDFRLRPHLREVVWLSTRASRIHWEGRPAVMALFEDITDRKQAEEQLAVYSENLEMLVEKRSAELQKIQEKLLRHEKLAALGQMAGSVAHELRHPLGVLSNAAYFLKMSLHEADERSKEYVEMISAEVRRSDKIISDLLDFSRNQAADTLVKASVLLPDLIAGVLAQHPTPEGIELLRRDDPELAPIFVDPQQVAQVLTNLVINAYQAMPEGGTLTLSTRQTAESSRLSNRDTSPPPAACHLPTVDCVLLTVKDTGCGIAPQHFEQLFEPLFTTKPKGIGLGLAICKNLVEANGGRIEVESVTGEGTRFTLMFPACPGKEANDR